MFVAFVLQLTFHVTLICWAEWNLEWSWTRIFHSISWRSDIVSTTYTFRLRCPWPVTGKSVLLFIGLTWASRASMMYWSFQVSVSIVEMAHHYGCLRRIPCPMFSTHVSAVSYILHITLMMYCYWHNKFMSDDKQVRSQHLAFGQKWNNWMIFWQRLDVLTNFLDKISDFLDG